MFYRAERIERILNELQSLIYRDVAVIENVLKKDGFFHSIASVNANDQPFLPFSVNQRWGGRQRLRLVQGRI